MPRRPAAITQADVARALRAVQAAGIRASVEVYPDGRIVIVPVAAQGEAAAVPARKPTEREIFL